MVVEVAQRRGDRIAVHREQRQLQAVRAQQRRRAERRADDDGVELVGDGPERHRHGARPSRERRLRRR